ncbi:MAG: prepilin-type N-terminal cleavage/methylation domain-containing protein [Syntrophaceae bacterium]|nr:prepilin-type N-terminal cleavage/methylation domain-containing protein [Syntrophaceae bacterium]
MRITINKSQKGFTILEIITILVVIAIIAAVAISRIGSTDDYGEAEELAKVKSHLRYAQGRAIRTNSVWGINFNSASTYFLFENSNPATHIRIIGEDNDQVTLSHLTISSTQSVTFDRFGSPGAADISIGTSAGNITVTANTGFVP